MVDFFFILSGFIMCHVYGKWFSGPVTFPEFKKFTIARFARVYPLHFITLLYTILLFYVAGKLGLPPDVVENQNSTYSILTNRTLPWVKDCSPSCALPVIWALPFLLYRS
jgi:peptidoglycan/LPS O-acetylase OafA/YrhL